MAIHHHKPSTTLARARQVRGYQSHLDLQTQKRKVEENKNKEEATFDSIKITMKEKKKDL